MDLERVGRSTEGGRRPATMLMILALGGGRGRFWTEPEAQGRSVPGKPRSADTLHRVRTSGCRCGRFKAVIRSGHDSVLEEPAARVSMADCESTTGADLTPGRPVALPGGRISLVPRAFSRRFGAPCGLADVCNTLPSVVRGLGALARGRGLWAPHPRERFDLSQRNNPIEADQGFW